MKKRLIGLDIFRITAAFVVFLFHCKIHLGCDFGLLNNFIHMGAIFMTGFFILSGYSLFVAYQKINLMHISEICIFYKKRCISVVPIYYVVGLLFVIFLGNETFGQIFVLAPAQLFGIQSVFSSLFPFSHNGGTWFISCLLMCYGIYPFIQEIIKQLSTKGRCLILLLAAFLLLYAPLVVLVFNTANIYSNPFFRILEFLIGVLLASCKEKIELHPPMRYLQKWSALVWETVLLILAVSVAVDRNLAVNDYMMYSWIALPIFILMFISLAGITSETLEKSKVIKYLSSLTYLFFLSQFFTWPLVKSIMLKMECNNSFISFILSFCICSVITTLLHELVEVPLTNYLSQRCLSKTK